MGLAWYQLLGARVPPLPRALLMGKGAARLLSSSTTSPSPFPPLGSLFRTSIPLIMGIVAVLFFLTFLVLFYTKYCRRRTLGGGDFYGSEGDADFTGYKRQDAGVDRAVVESLPVIPFHRRDDGTECAVCLRRFTAGELLRALPKCMHAFHIGCVDQWLATHSTCPLCRLKVEPGDVLLPLPAPPAGPKPHAAAVGRATPVERRLFMSGEVVLHVAGGTRVASPPPPARSKPRWRSVDDALMLRGVATLEREHANKRSLPETLEDQIVVAGESDRETVDGEGIQWRWSDLRPQDLRILRPDMALADVDGCSVWPGRASSCSSVSASFSSSGAGDRSAVGWRSVPGMARRAVFGGGVEGRGLARPLMAAAARWLGRPR